MSDLVERLRAVHTAGYDEWRVQDPKDGSYCISFSWPEVANPEREAREWLADTKRRHPDYPHAGYEVACVRVVPEKDALIAEAAAELERLQAENERLCAGLHEILRVHANDNLRPKAFYIAAAAMQQEPR